MHGHHHVRRHLIQNVWFSKAAPWWWRLSHKCGISCICYVASSGSDYCVRGSDVHWERHWTKGSVRQLDGYDLWIVIKSEDSIQYTFSKTSLWECCFSFLYFHDHRVDYFTQNWMTRPQFSPAVQNPPVTFANGWLFFFYISARKSSIFT